MHSGNEIPLIPEKNAPDVQALIDSGELTDTSQLVVIANGGQPKYVTPGHQLITVSPTERPEV